MGASNQFHSVLASAIPSSGVVGDVWYTTDTKLLYAVVGDGSLVQLLVSTPIPVAGPQGPTGATGPAGPNFIGTVGFFGNWLASPQTYQAGSIIAFQGFLYISKAILQIGDNVQNPQMNGSFWQILGPSTFSGRQAEIICVMDGSGIALTAPSFHGSFTIPFPCTISSWVLTADQVGSASVSVKWSTFANLPATVDITAGSGPSLAAAQKSSGSAAGWSPTSFQTGDQLEIDLLSASTITLLTLTLEITSN